MLNLIFIDMVFWKTTFQPATPLFVGYANGHIDFRVCRDEYTWPGGEVNCVFSGIFHLYLILLGSKPGTRKSPGNAIIFSRKNGKISKVLGLFIVEKTATSYKSQRGRNHSSLINPIHQR